MENDVRTINLVLYLQVLGMLPDVTEGDVDSAMDVFQEAVNGTMGEVPFGVGKSGDGGIEVNCDWSEIYEGKAETVLHLNERGELFNREIGFEAKMPFRLARYFIASLFGKDELTKFAREHFYEPESKRTTDSTQLEKTPLRVRKLLRGVNLLYSCAQKQGSVEACMTSDGMEMIEEAKAK